MFKKLILKDIDAPAEASLLLTFMTNTHMERSYLISDFC